MPNIKSMVELKDVDNYIVMHNPRVDGGVIYIEEYLLQREEAINATRLAVSRFNLMFEMNKGFCPSLLKEDAVEQVINSALSWRPELEDIITKNPSSTFYDKKEMFEVYDAEDNYLVVLKDKERGHQLYRFCDRERLVGIARKAYKEFSKEGRETIKAFLKHIDYQRAGE